MITREVEVACRELIFHCLRSLDSRQYKDVAACFAETGVWERAGEILEGPQGVRAALDRRPADLQTQHLVSNMTLGEEGAGTVVAEYSVAAYTQRGTSPVELHGIFKARDRLIRLPTGWCFLLRSAIPAFVPHG